MSNVGLFRDEITDKGFRAFCPTNEEYQTIEQIYPIVSRLGYSTIETQLSRKNGELIHVSLSFNAINKKALSQGVAVSLTNITERKRVEQRLEQATE